MSRKRIAQKSVFLNQRGQAALVDSLFFVSIVAAICVWLLFFAINYGSAPDSLLHSFYTSDFAMDSLKVVSYINVMRDGNPVSIANERVILPNLEYDYLLTIIKEDYARNQKISDSTKKAIANTLYSVLLPFDDSRDYVFYIAKEGATSGEMNFLTLIFAVHEKTATALNTDKILSCAPGYIGDRTVPDGENCYFIDRVFYSCSPIVRGILERRVLPAVGKVDTATGRISLPVQTGDLSTTSPHLMGLSIWVSAPSKVLNQLKDSNSDFNCSVIKRI